MGHHKKITLLFWSFTLKCEMTNSNYFVLTCEIIIFVNCSRVNWRWFGTHCIDTSSSTNKLKEPCKGKDFYTYPNKRAKVSKGCSASRNIKCEFCECTIWSIMHLFAWLHLFQNKKSFEFFANWPIGSQEIVLVHILRRNENENLKKSCFNSDSIERNWEEKSKVCILVAFTYIYNIHTYFLIKP